MLKHVDLCSGIGGFALGFEWAGLSTPHLFCDIEPWCRDILKQHWPNVPIKSDVKELANDPDRFIPDCDILTAGYPCQPFSSAGKRKGEEDDRHIWPYIRTIVAHKRPSWVVFENVNGHISLGLDTVLSNLEAEGYTTRPFVIPACSVGAPHRRDRLWIVGHTEDNGCDRGAETVGREGIQSEQNQSQLEIWSKLSRPSEDVADTKSIRVQGLRPSGEQESHTHVRQEVSVRNSQDVADTDSDRTEWSKPENGKGGRAVESSANVADTFSQRTQSGSAGRQDAKNVGESSRGTEQWNWNIEPDVGRVANGIPKRVDRIKGLGNAIVPQIAQQIGTAIKVAHYG